MAWIFCWEPEHGQPVGHSKGLENKFCACNGWSFAGNRNRQGLFDVKDFDGKAPWYLLAMMKRQELAGVDDDVTSDSTACNSSKASTAAMGKFGSCVDSRVRMLQ